MFSFFLAAPHSCSAAFSCALGRDIEKPDKIMRRKRSGCRCSKRALERFQAKWKPVRVKKTRQIKNLEPRFDSIEAEKALDRRRVT
jgi:hypothetical protein